MHKQSIFLWSVERNNIIEGYMFGTIHVPFTEVWEQSKLIEIKKSFIITFILLLVNLLKYF